MIIITPLRWILLDHANEPQVHPDMVANSIVIKIRPEFLNSRLDKLMSMKQAGKFVTEASNALCLYENEQIIINAKTAS